MTSRVGVGEKGGMGTGREGGLNQSHDELSCERLYGM